MSRPIVVIVGDDDALVTEALRGAVEEALGGEDRADRKSTRLNSSHT